MNKERTEIQIYSRMRNSILSYGLLIVFGLLISTMSFGNMSASLSATNISTTKTEQSAKKLSLKERIILKKLQKKAKKQSPKKVTKEQGSAIGKIFLGILLAVIGVFGILAAILSISASGIIWGVALIVIGALVIAWGALDVVF